jgi:hypothetical protein
MGTLQRFIKSAEGTLTSLETQLPRFQSRQKVLPVLQRAVASLPGKAQLYYRLSVEEAKDKP